MRYNQFHYLMIAAAKKIQENYPQDWQVRLARLKSHTVPAQFVSRYFIAEQSAQELHERPLRMFIAPEMLDPDLAGPDDDALEALVCGDEDLPRLIADRVNASHLLSFVTDIHEGDLSLHIGKPVRS